MIIEAENEGHEEILRKLTDYKDDARTQVWNLFRVA